MIKFSFFFLTTFLLPMQVTQGQSLTVKGMVFKHQTREGLPFVSIGVKHTTRGTSSDAQGRFALEAESGDTLVFSSVGFQTLLVPAREIQEAVFLQEAVTLLGEVKVTRSERFRTSRVGNTNGKTVISTGGANQYAMLLQQPLQTDAVLENVYFALQPDTRKNDRWRTAVKIRVYANDNGMPGSDLLPENIVIALDKADKRLIVDVAKYAILIPKEGVFIGLDFIGYFNRENAFIPYSRQNRPLNLRIPFSSYKAPFESYSKFFGTGWQPVSHRTGNGEQVHISAKFGAKIIH